MKTKLSYTVRTTRAPGETRDSIVPVIVERLNPVELETVVENCIDRGLIAGLKTTAAHGIAEGVATQIAREFSLGRGVQFGQYFYGRPYLSGTVDANGRLTSDNKINVRLYKGADFKLKLDDFSFTFDGAGDSVKLDNVYGDTPGAGGNTYGQVVEGSPVKVNGRNLYAAGDTDKVIFTEVGGSVVVEVADFAFMGADLLSFAWPAGLVAGKRYSVEVERTDVNGMTGRSQAKTVTVVTGATPPEPEPEGESSDGTVKVMSIVDADPTAAMPTSGHQWKINGEGLRHESAEGDEWLIDNVDIRGDGFQELFQMDSETPDHTQLTITCPDLEVAAGDYTATITINLSRRGGEDTEAITINKMVRIPQA